MFHQTDTLSYKCRLRALSVVVFCLLQTQFCRGQSHFIGPPQPIVVTLGDNVVLPCHLEPAQDAEGFTLEWTRPDLEPRFVHVWRSGVELGSKKNPSYQGRTSLFTDELKNGNISLKLSKVKPSDEGRYRCYIPVLEQQFFVEVLASAVSSPVVALAGIDRTSRGVVLECRSSGWYPEPEVSWLDAEGNLLSAGRPETVRGPDDLYTVSSRVTVEKRHGDTFTCRVQQKKTKQTTETQVYVPDDFFMESSTIITGLSVSLAVVIIALILLIGFVWKTRLNTNKTRQKNRSGTDAHTVQCSSKEEEEEEERDTLFKAVLVEAVDAGERQNETKDSAQVEQQTSEEPEEKENKQLHTGSFEVLEVDPQEPDNNTQENKQLETNQTTSTPLVIFNWFTSSAKKQQPPKEQQTTETDAEKAEMEKTRQSAEQREETSEELKSTQRQLGEKDFAIVQLKRHEGSLMADIDKLKQELTMKNEQFQFEKNRADNFKADLKKMVNKTVEFMQKYENEKSLRENAEKEVQSLRAKLQIKSNETTKPKESGSGTCARVSQIPDQQQQTSKTSRVTVDKVDPLGRNVCLRNNSNKNQPMGGWTLIIKIDNNEPIAYTFDESFRLNTGKTITIWAEGCRGSFDSNNELLWKGQNPWNIGEKVTVTIRNKEGQVEDGKRAELKHTSSQEASEPNRTSLTQSSDSGPDVTVEIDDAGKYVNLKNQSNKDLELLGWKLTLHVEKKKPITYTFKSSFILSGGKYVAIWASGCGLNNPPSSLLWKELKSWGRGKKVEVTVSSPPDHKVKSIFHFPS